MRALTRDEVKTDFDRENRLIEITRLLSAPCDLELYEQAILLQERHAIILELERRAKGARLAACPHCGRV
jgi:hypothetical protein